MINTQTIVYVAGSMIHLPLHDFVEMYGPSPGFDAVTRYKRAKLNRRATFALLRVAPEKRARLSVPNGRYFLGILSEDWRSSTLAEVLVKAVRYLHEHNADALERLAMRRKYTRAYVARDRADLYGSRADLIHFAREFSPGWYVDTNLSYENTCRFLSDVLSEAGFVHKRDWYFGRL